jgi:NDP-sugar pyrophosphorylase family protein
VIRYIERRPTRPIGGHLFLFPIELLTSINPIDVVDFHLRQRAGVTVVASRYVVEEKELQSSPVSRALDQRPSRYIVYDEADPTRLVALLSDESALSTDLDLMLSHDEEEQPAGGGADRPGMQIASSHLAGFRSLLVDGSLHLTGIYVVAPAAIAELRQQRGTHSLESEFIPNACALANGSISLFVAQKTAFTLRVADWASLFQANVRCASRRLPGFKPAGEFVALEGEAGYFTEGVKPDRFRCQADCVYGEGLSVAADDVTIVRSVIGRYCKIGKGSKIFNSVLFDHVTVGEGVTLRNCLIGDSATVGTGCKLTQCGVGAKFECRPGSEETNKFLKADEQEQ